jgi:uncharacterized protein (DUF1499 family)
MRVSLNNKSASQWVASLLPALALGTAGVAVLLAVLAGVGSRFGWWTFRFGFIVLGYGAYAGIGAALLGVWGAATAIRARQTTGIILMLLAIADGVTVAAVPASWRMHARQLPVIHDITTDTINPPQFVAILPLRRDAPNPALYAGREVAEKQHAAYPELRTEVLDLPPNQAFERALTVARSTGWHIVAAEPAQGRIEATDTTFWFGFTDDIVIRITSAGERSLLDIRSESRVGKSDVGTNATRIRSYFKQLRAYR